MFCAEASGSGFIQNNRRVMSFRPEGTGDLFGHIHPVSTLVIEDDAVPARGQLAVHTEGRCLIGHTAVIAVYRKGIRYSPVSSAISSASFIRSACRSKAVLRMVGSSLPRTEALRRIPRQAFRLK